MSLFQYPGRVEVPWASILAEAVPDQWAPTWNQPCARPRRFLGWLAWPTDTPAAAAVPDLVTVIWAHPSRAISYAAGSRSVTPAYVEPMTLEMSLVAELRNLASLASHVGNRIYPETIPQRGSRPCLIYDLQAEPRVYDLDGPSEIAEATILLEIQADLRATCRAIADIVRKQLGNFGGPLGGDQGVTVIELVLKTESSEAWVEGDGDDTPIRATIQEYLIRWREAH